MADISHVKVRLETGTVHGATNWSETSIQASADSAGSFLHHGSGYIRPMHMSVSSKNSMHSRYFVKFDQGPELEVDDGIIATDGHRISRIYLSSPESRGEYYAGLYNHSMGTSDLHLKAFADAIGLIAPGRPGQGYLWTAAIPELAASMMTTFTGQPMYVVVGSFITGGWLLGLVLFWDRPRSRRYASARQAFDAQSAQLTALLDQQLSEARV
jgi:hypothetical protein